MFNADCHESKCVVFIGCFSVYNFCSSSCFFGFIYSPISTCFIGGDWVCSARAINNIVAYRCDEKYLELGKINAG